MNDSFKTYMETDLVEMYNHFNEKYKNEEFKTQEDQLEYFNRIIVYVYNFLQNKYGTDCDIKLIQLIVSLNDEYVYTFYISLDNKPIQFIESKLPIDVLYEVNHTQYAIDLMKVFEIDIDEYTMEGTHKISE